MGSGNVTQGTEGWHWAAGGREEVGAAGMMMMMPQLGPPPTRPCRATWATVRRGLLIQDGGGIVLGRRGRLCSPRAWRYTLFGGTTLSPAGHEVHVLG